MNLVLYHYWRSSSSWRVRFALEHKGLPYGSKFVNLLQSEQLTDEHKQISPMGVVPCLLVDGRPLTESMAICEYLEEVAPERPLVLSAIDITAFLECGRVQANDRVAEHDVRFVMRKGIPRLAGHG